MVALSSGARRAKSAGGAPRLDATYARCCAEAKVPADAATVRGLTSEDVLRVDVDRTVVYSAVCAFAEAVADSKTLALRGISLQSTKPKTQASGDVNQKRAVARLFRGVARPLAAAGSGVVWLELAGLERLDPSSSEALGRGLRASQLRLVSFHDCAIREDGFAQSLAPALAASNCAYVALTNCGLTDRSATAIAAIARAHGARRDEAMWARNLRKTSVTRYAGGGVGVPRAEGGVATGADRAFPLGRGTFFQMMPAAVMEKGLLVLDVSGNQLGDATCAELATCVSSDDWLMGLNLRGNGAVTARGAAKLHDAVLGRAGDADEEGALLALCLDSSMMNTTTTNAAKKVRKVLDARLRGRDAADLWAKGPLLRAARAAMALWAAGASDPPSVELVIAKKWNASATASAEDEDLELLAREVFGASATLKAADFEKALLREKVRVEARREAKACAAAARRLLIAQQLQANSSLEVWLTATAVVAGAVSKVQLRAALIKALYAPEPGDRPDAGSVKLVEALMKRTVPEASRDNNNMAAADVARNFVTLAGTSSNTNKADHLLAKKMAAADAAFDALERFKTAKQWRAAQVFANALDDPAAAELSITRFNEALRRWRAEGALLSGDDDYDDDEVTKHKNKEEEEEEEDPEAAFARSSAARRGAHAKKPHALNLNTKPRVAARESNLSAYLVGLGGDTSRRIDGVGLEKALDKAKDQAEDCLDDARGAILLRKTCTALSELSTNATDYFQSLVDSGEEEEEEQQQQPPSVPSTISLESLASGLESLLGVPRARSATDAALVASYADAEQAEALALDEVLNAYARALDDEAADGGGEALSVVWHAVGAQRVEALVKSRKWTVPRLTLQVASAAKRLGKTTNSNSKTGAQVRSAFSPPVDDVAVTAEALDLALGSWTLDTAPPPLADDEALEAALEMYARRRERATTSLKRSLKASVRATKHRRHSRKTTSASASAASSSSSSSLEAAATAGPLGPEVTVADVLAFARHVADDTGTVVDVERCDGAIRHARRAALRVEDLERGAEDLEDLRRRLVAARSLDLDAWLEACTTARSEATISARELRVGLLGLLETTTTTTTTLPPQEDEPDSSGNTPNYLTPAEVLIARGVQALGAFLRLDDDFADDFVDVEIDALRAANAKAAFVTQGGPSREDLLDFAAGHASEEDNQGAVNRVARRLDEFCARRKWRVADAVEEASVRDQAGNVTCSPRALARAMRVWELYYVDAGQRALYDRSIGPAERPASVKTLASSKSAASSSSSDASHMISVVTRTDPFPTTAPVSKKKKKKKVVVSAKKTTTTVTLPMGRPRSALASRPRTAEDPDHDLLITLESAVLAMANKISNIEGYLMTPQPTADA